MIISVAKRTMYQAFGMRIWSEIALPELIEADEQDGPPDVAVQVMDLSGDWDDSLFRESYVAVKDRQVLFCFPNAARVCVRDGSRIAVSPMAGADEDMIRIYLLGSCMGAILMQRQILPLHGSAIVYGGRAYAFVGESGAGKSTLAAAFLNRGLSLASDDVIAVTLAANGTPVVTPSYPQQKLWQESIVGLGLEAERYSPLYRRVNKYAVPVPGQFAAAPIPLAAVFELLPTENDMSIRRLQGLARLPVLRFHTYRGILVPFLQLDQWHFTMIASIISRVDVFQISRPSTGFTAQQLASQILEVIDEGE